MQKFLSKCADIEGTVALIYQEFARNPQSDKTLMKIWQDLATDEEAHVQQLKLAMRLPTQSVFNGLSSDSPDPDELLRVARELLVKAREGQMSLLDMLKSAVVLEKDFRKVHATCSLLFKEAPLKKTFSALAKADGEHLAALDAYLKDYKAQHASS